MIWILLLGCASSGAPELALACPELGIFPQVVELGSSERGGAWWTGCDSEVVCTCDAGAYLWSSPDPRPGDLVVVGVAPGAPGGEHACACEGSEGVLVDLVVVTDG